MSTAFIPPTNPRETPTLNPGENEDIVLHEDHFDIQEERKYP